MEFRNLTPLPALQFDSRDEQKRDFGVVVLRGTFDIKNNQPLLFADKQEPIVMSDEYHGMPGESSIHIENNLAPFKPTTDIHINAIAHSPDYQPMEGWLVTARVGVIEKKLLVIGQRYWKRGLMGWELTKRMPCRQIPIQYENAFGGICANNDENRPDFFRENLLGKGFVNDKFLIENKEKLIPVPQIMSVEDPVLKLKKVYKPEGFGPLSPAWLPRINYAGTFNVIWEKTRWPDLPEDFKYNFYNSAHPDLVYPSYVKGDESVFLKNLSLTPVIEFSLPGYAAALLVRWENGTIAPLPMVLDTIHIEVPKMKTYLVWRGTFPLTKPIRVLEARVRKIDGNNKEIKNV